ncbi:ATP-binding cassette domain-containing protein [Novosphingobium sp. 17-62-19]|uniref:ABC transporter ATP-binding protein n=1 Tax=Novosphingobium sp. 17-62-19 TaxID=1970406 RepID=UPI0034508BD0
MRSRRHGYCLQARGPDFVPGPVAVRAFRRDALAFWQRIDRAEPEQADFGLADLLDVPVRYLSTGQRKRAALARVAASGAPLWLLDEPLNGLDTYWSCKAQAAIDAHCRAGGAVVIASHQPLALEQVDEIKLLDFQP